MSDLSGIHTAHRYIKTDARNRLVTFSYAYEGFVLSGQAEIEPGAEDHDDMPGYDADAWLLEVNIDGKPESGLLNPTVEHWIVEKILKENAK